MKNILLGINSTPKETIIKITKIFKKVEKKGYTKVAGELEHVFKDKNILYTMGVKRKAKTEITMIEKYMLIKK